MATIAMALFILAQVSPAEAHIHTAMKKAPRITMDFGAKSASNLKEANLTKPCTDQSDAGCDLTGSSSCPLGCGLVFSAEQSEAIPTRLRTMPALSARLDGATSTSLFRPPILHS